MSSTPSSAGAILGTALRLRFLGGLTAIAPLIGIAYFVLPDVWTLVALASLSLLLQPAAVVDLWFQRHLASRRSVIARTTVIYTGGATKLLLVAFGAPLVAFVAMLVLEAVLYATGFVIAYHLEKASPPDPWRWDPSTARNFLQAGLPLALASVLAALGGRVDQVFVAVRLSDIEAGFYLAAGRFTEFVLFAGASLISSLYPRLSEAADDPVLLQERLRGLFDAVSGLSWAAAIGLSLLAQPLVAIILGPNYALSAPILIA
ncbi:MAG: oligosaccharide flippase family protein [Candidatus Synoicihabitans palmerolidicus]|nr:oligosaccharide flippase family protein [Candidatus Synoicihabitans palmerolidicus]